VVRAGWQPGEIRSKMFRHTYCAARLQTLDQGAPVSAYTVAKELGHGGESMVRRVYGHLGRCGTGRTRWNTASSSTLLSWGVAWRRCAV
jgi:integrase